LSVRRLRVLLLGWNYAPEVAGIGPYNTELAEGLTERGHEVTAVTSFPLYPEWQLQPGGGGFLRWEVLNGVSVRRGWAHIPRPRSAASRILFDCSVTGMALLNGLPLRGVDVVICVLPPLQMAISGLAIARLHCAATVLHLQDIVPDLAVSSGMMSDTGTAFRIARRLETFAYAHADRISVITPGFRRNLAAKGVPEEKLVTLPNWVRLPKSVPASGALGLRAKFGLPLHGYLLIHAGNMGEKQALDGVVAAAGELEGKSEVHIVLVGDGQARAHLQAMVAERGLSNVTFLPFQEDLASLLGAADALLLTQRPELVDSVIPSKLLAYMAAARPVLASAHPDGDTARMVTESGCGLLVNPAEADSLAVGIRTLAALPAAAAAEYGASGRRFANRLQDREAVLDRWEAMLLGLT